MNKIEMININKSYNDKQIFDNFSCQFIEGNNVIMGESGIGKTTLLRILLGLESYTGDIKGLEGKRISCVFQENRLLEDYSARDNLTFANQSLKDEEINEALRQVGLANALDMPVKNFSGGMKRKLAILRALLTAHDVIIMDEPFKELDEESYKIILSYVESRTEGKIFILSTHSNYERNRFAGNLIKI